MRECCDAHYRTHLSGLPLFFYSHFSKDTGADIALVRSIFWGCGESNLSRVLHIPSWTWAGWRGFGKGDGPYRRFVYNDWRHFSVDLEVHALANGSLHSVPVTFFDRIGVVTEEDMRHCELVDTIQITGWGIRIEIAELSEFQVKWDSTEHWEEHKSDPLYILVVAWSCSQPWRLLVLGQTGSADSAFYHRLGTAQWREPDGSGPRAAKVAGQKLTRQASLIK